MDLILTNKRYLIVSAHTPMSESNVPTTFSRPYPANVKLMSRTFLLIFCNNPQKTLCFHGADVRLVSSPAKIDVKLVSSYIKIESPFRSKTSLYSNWVFRHMDESLHTEMSLIQNICHPPYIIWYFSPTRSWPKYQSVFKTCCSIHLLSL